MDDILVFGKSYREHDERLDKVLARLLDSDLTLNEKCQFRRQSLIFLGHQVSASGILPDPSKVAAIVNMLSPTNIAGVRRFLGMVNHFGRYVDKLAEKTKPLRNLLKDSADFGWDVSQQNAFDILKENLQNCVELAIFSPQDRTIVSTDGISVGFGAVLLQESEPGVRRLIAFASRCLTPTEQRYAQIEKETHAVTWTCEKFRMFLVGKAFHLETDHRPLVPLFSTKCLDDLPPRIQRFRMRLMCFNFSISHVPGKELATADTLSRAAVSQPCERDNDFVIEVNNYVNCIIANGNATENRLKEIAKLQAEDSTCRRLIDRNVYVRMASCKKECYP
uniref:RNA-directed DNA polymerase n=1 Tax=Trichuris muris TaxID=70415 RepID=A0A5S6QT17_TRIMR